MIYSPINTQSKQAEINDVNIGKPETPQPNPKYRINKRNLTKLIDKVDNHDDKIEKICLKVTDLEDQLEVCKKNNIVFQNKDIDKQNTDLKYNYSININTSIKELVYNLITSDKNFNLKSFSLGIFLSFILFLVIVIKFF